MLSGEVDDLSGRLKTSRQRVADLERSLSTSNTSSQNFEQVCILLASETIIILTIRDRMCLDMVK